MAPINFDLYTELNKNMKDVVTMVQTRLEKYDAILDDKTGNKASSSGTSELSILKADYINFKDFVMKYLSLLQRQLELLMAGYDRHEIISRKKVLLVHGMREENQEQLDDKIVNILKGNLKLPNVEHDKIDICHRLGPKSEKPRPVLVRFTSVKLRSEIWRTKSHLKGSGLTISEFLTKPRQETFMAARKYFGVGQCWSADGNVIIQLPDKSRKKIVSMSELQSLMDIYPSYTQASQDTKQTRSRRAPKK